MIETIAKSYLRQCPDRAFPALCRWNASINQWLHDVLQCALPRQQMEALEHKTDFAITNHGEFVLGQ